MQIPMASKERIQRLKENTRSNILSAALKIVKKAGWNALSMRRIAEEIDYTAPFIYEYFASKQSLVSELTNAGYRRLSFKILEAKNSAATPARQLEVMWLAYWQFAFAERELYQAMFGVDLHCSSMDGECPKAEEISALFSGVIRQLMADRQTPDEVVCTKYFSFWSLVHGLISINLVHKGSSDEINQHVLNDALRGLIAGIDG